MTDLSEQCGHGLAGAVGTLPEPQATLCQQGGVGLCGLVSKGEGDDLIVFFLAAAPYRP